MHQTESTGQCYEPFFRWNSYFFGTNYMDFTKLFPSAFVKSVKLVSPLLASLF